ncbi:esterase E4-like isoform X1 [Schistocerca piceifrons]|uniref:esterase E4-like isoform X1 n=1 Tax=Schistocerca piceifrons TaxID=274613 RepID=UPI001F5F5798|nr:esterase E4-like isoform X1 [Schistocerca piceifrons]
MNECANQNRRRYPCGKIIRSETGACAVGRSTSIISSPGCSEVLRLYSTRTAGVETVTVKVAQGILKGKVVEAKYGGKYCSFQGIRYAKPPVGTLRFQPPQPPESWTGTRDALEEGAVAPHANWVGKKYKGEEDCLFLNVYTSKITSQNEPLKAVMVWFHGGAFGFGSGNTDLYGPDYLVAADVIVVTLNYRLGALGFLSLEDATIPGNNGLKDQVAALRWIQQNMINFGGDPDNVTIFGQSAGGASVQYHLISPMSKGLFHKAIAQSGSVFNPWASRKALKERSFTLGAVLGCNTNDPKVLIDFLRTCTPKQIVEGTAEIVTLDDKRRGKNTPFLPIPENDSGSLQEVFLPDNPQNIVKSGKFCDVPYLTGITSHEGIMELKNILKKPQLLKEIDNDFERLVPEDMELGEKSERLKKASDMIRQFYFDGKPFTKDNIMDYVNLQTDIMFACGMYQTAKYHVKYSRSPLYCYNFGFDGALGVFKSCFGASHLPGACHVDDIGYLFHMSAVDITVEHDSIEMSTIRRMVKLWTNFAKTGDPTPHLDADVMVKWTPNSQTNPCYLNIDKDLTIRQNLNKERMEFWDDLYK